MAQTVNDILDEMVDASVDPRFKTKVDRMKDQMSEEELARWLFDRSALPDDLKHKYGLDKTLSNVSAGEIPEEAPDYIGDVGTAEEHGLAPSPAAPEPSEADGDDGLVDVEDYNDLSIADLKATIEARNEGRSDEDAIPMPTGNKKQPYVDALEYDDGVADTEDES